MSEIFWIFFESLFSITIFKINLLGVLNKNMYKFLTLNAENGYTVHVYLDVIRPIKPITPLNKRKNAMRLTRRTVTSITSKLPLRRRFDSVTNLWSRIAICQHLLSVLLNINLSVPQGK